MSDALALDAATLKELYATVLKTPGVRELIRSDVLSISAAPFSALDKRVRDGLRPRAGELTTGSGTTGLSPAITLVMLGARVVWNREKLTPEMYETIAALFRARGVTVPTV
ncbi:hypothetical protein [Microbacterium sp.]|uniref:hypothetical protein n=1 Tax=Microbacterium sp. TaxID=51671 RepID=UPI0039E48E79